MYSIYHIPSVKIGVSKNPRRRVKKQGYDNYQILEEHTDVYEVSDREQELQRQYGYEVDKVPYWQSSKSGSKGGKIGGNTTALRQSKTRQLSKIQQASKRPILQYDLNGNFIREWECNAYASKELNIAKSSIHNICNGIQHKSKGFTFKYKK